MHDPAVISCGQGDVIILS